jgi:hypothetical protein
MRAIACPSVIIDDLDPFGALAPHKADAPLVIDPDAVLSASLPFQRFEAIAGRRPQVGQLGGHVQHVEFAHRHPPDGLERSNGFAP